MKEPRLGEVKTRLARDTGPRRALQLYRAFAADAFEAALGVRGAKVVAHCSERAAPRPRRPGRTPAWLRALLGPARARRVEVHPQTGKDLGHRLRNAFREAFARGAGPVVVLGTDCPLLTSQHLEAAVGALRHAELVILPSPDGGYNLLGLRREAPRLFEDVPWSTAQVLAATLAAARREGLTVELLEQLQDIDTVTDLAAVGPLILARPAGSLQARHTRGALAAAAGSSRPPPGGATRGAPGRAPGGRPGTPGASPGSSRREARRGRPRGG